MARDLTVFDRSFPLIARSIALVLAVNLSGLCLSTVACLPAVAGTTDAAVTKPPGRSADPRTVDRKTPGRSAGDKKSVSAKMAYLETMTIGQVISDAPFESRLERLERLILGKSESGNPNLRLARLMERAASEPGFGGTMHLKGGVAKSNLDEEDQLRIDSHGEGAAIGKPGSRLRARVNTTRALRVSISIGGSHFVNCFNDKTQIDRAATEFASYIGNYMKGAPVSDRTRVRLTLKDDGAQSGFAGITVSVPQGRDLPATSSFCLVHDPIGYGTSRISTAGFAAFSHTDGSTSYSQGGSVTASKPAVRSVHLSPLIIHVSAGGSDVAGSFNDAPADSLNQLIRDGNLRTVPSARPYALSVSLGTSRLSNSFDIGSGKSAEASINAFAASSDFQDQSRGEIDPDGNEVRPLVLTISAGGSHIDGSFNNTGGAVRLANEIADKLEAYVKPSALAGILQIHLAKGGCQLENAYSKL